MSEPDSSTFQFPEIEIRSNNSFSSAGGRVSPVHSIRTHYSSAELGSNSSESSSNASDGIYDKFIPDTSTSSVPSTPKNNDNDYTLADSYRNNTSNLQRSALQKLNQKAGQKPHNPLSVFKTPDQIARSTQSSPNSSHSSTPIYQQGGGTAADRRTGSNVSNNSNASSTSSGLLVGASSATVGTNTTNTTGVNGNDSTNITGNSVSSSGTSQNNHLSNDLTSTLKSSSTHASNNIVDNYDWHNDSSNEGSSTGRESVSRSVASKSGRLGLKEPNKRKSSDQRKLLSKINTEFSNIRNSKAKGIKDNRYLTKNQVLAYKSFLNNINFNKNQSNFLNRDSATKSSNKNHLTASALQDEKYEDFLSIAPSLIDGYTLTSQLTSSSQLPILMYHAIDDLSGEKVLIRMSPNYIEFNSIARFLNEWYILSNLNTTAQHRLFSNELLSNEFMPPTNKIFLDKSDPAVYQPVTLPHEIPGVLYPMKILNIDSHSTEIYQKRMGFVFQDYDYVTLKDFHGDSQESFVGSSWHSTNNANGSLSGKVNGVPEGVEKLGPDEVSSYTGDSIPTSSSSMISANSTVETQTRMATKEAVGSVASNLGVKSGIKFDEFQSRMKQQPQTPLKIIQILNDVISLLKTLATVHELGIVHNGITSHTILKSTDENLAMNKVVLTRWDFCFSIQQEDCSHGIRRLNLTDVPELLPYLSPEATGEFSSQVDYRTDFYSLGVVLYELIVGVLPFQSENPSKVIRMHLLQKPIAPSLIGHGWITDDLSDIILKCLEKAAMNRYPDCFSLINALITVKNTYVGNIVKLQPVHGNSSLNSDSLKTPEPSLNTSLNNSSHSNSSTKSKVQASLNNFYVPYTSNQKAIFVKEAPYFPEKCNLPPRISASSQIYGRDADFKEFINIYESMRNGVNLLLIKGPEGLGKSSLLLDLKTTAISKYDFYTHWKFNRQDGNVSMYSCFLHGIRSVVTQILNGSSENIAIWRDIITSKIQVDLTILFNNVPELKTLLGPKYASIHKNRRKLRKSLESHLSGEGKSAVDDYDDNDDDELSQKYANLHLNDSVDSNDLKVDDSTINLELKFRYIIKAFYCAVGEQGYTCFYDDFQLCTKNEWAMFGEIIDYAKINDINLSVKLVSVYDEKFCDFESDELLLNLDQFKECVSDMDINLIEYDLSPFDQESFVKFVFNEFVHDYGTSNNDHDNVNNVPLIISDYSSVSALSVDSTGKALTLSTAKEEEIRHLAVDFYKITGGSILLLRYLIRALHFQGNVKFDVNHIKQEKTIGIRDTTSVVSLTLEDVPRFYLESALTPDAKSLMKFAALIAGAENFSLADLMIVSKLSMKQVFELLQLCLETKVLIPTSAFYKLPFHLMSSGDFPFDLSDALIWDLSAKTTYRFSHDFLQLELLRELVQDNEIKNYHRLCGLRYYKVMKNDDLINITKYLVMATHLCKSWEVAENHEHELYFDALINAARYANSTYNLVTSLQFFEIAEHFLDKSDAKRRLRLILALCQIRFYLRQFDNCLTMIDMVEKEYGFDETMFLMIRIRCYFQQKDFEKGLKFAIKCLRKLGIDISMDPKECKKTYERTLSQLPLSVSDIKKMAHLPITKNPKILMIYELISEIIAPSYVANMDNLRQALVTQMVLLMHMHGRSAYCSMALLEFGDILSKEDNYADMMKSIEFCKLGLHFVEYDKETSGSVAQHVYESYVTGLAALSEPLSNILRYYNVFLSSKKSFLRLDFNSMAVIVNFSKIHLLYLNGYPTPNLVKLSPQQFFGYGDKGMNIQLDFLNMYCGNISVEVFKNKYSGAHSKGRDFELCYYSSLIYWYSAHGLYGEACTIFLDHCYELLKKLPLKLVHFEVYFQAAVALTRNTNPNRKKGYEVGREVLKKFELWSTFTPANFLAKYLIIKACFSAIDKESASLDTLDLFEEAIEKGKEASSWYDVGQAHLLCATWLVSTKKSTHRIENHVRNALQVFKRLESRVFISRVEKQFSKYLEGYSWAGIESVKHEFIAPSTPTSIPGPSPLGLILKDFFGEDSSSAEKSLQRNKSRFFGSLSAAHSASDLTVGGDTADLAKGKRNYSTTGEMKNLPPSSMAILTKAITACLTITESTQDEIIISNLLESSILFSDVDYGVVVTLLNEEPTLQAIASPNTTYRLENEPLSSRTDLCPFSLLMHVLHTGDDVNQDDDPIYFATRFGKDDYYLHNQCITSICIPLKTQTGIFGAIYLENQIKTSDSKAPFFNSQKYDLLQLICSQAAVSLEKAKLYSQMEVAKRAAEDATAEKASFLANMSHEIRTPFNSLLACSIFLLDTELTKTQREYVETIKSSAMVTLSIIDGILAFSKIEHGSFTLDNAPFSLNDCIESALQLSAEQAASNNIELVYFNRCQFIDTIIGDVTRFRQIIINLVGNSVKFTSNGYIRIESTATKVTHDRYEIIVSVKDTGIGIPDDSKLKVFGAFSQVDGSSRRVYGGSGLGLAISKKLADIMNGSLSFESVEGEGSTFYFISNLQVNLEEKPEIYFDDEEAKRLGFTNNALIIDNHELNKQVLGEMIQSFGLNVTYIDKVKDFKTTENDFAVIFLDHDQIDDFKSINDTIDTSRCRIVLLARFGQALPHGIEQCCIHSIIFSPFQRNKISLSIKQLINDMKEPSKYFKGYIMDKSSKISNAESTKNSLFISDKYPLRILLAEDNLINIKVALQHLKKLGYEADHAKDGVEVIAKCEALLEKNEKYDIILMDIQMPRKDGIAATIELKESFIHKGKADYLPDIVALTANVAGEDRARSLNCGMVDFISKPILPSELKRVLESLGIKSKEKKEIIEEP